MSATRAGGQDSLRPSRNESNCAKSQTHTSKSNPPGINRLSIVNLLYDDGTPAADPHNSTTPSVAHRANDQLESSLSAPGHAHHNNLDTNASVVMDNLSPTESANLTKRATTAHSYRKGTFPTNQPCDNFGRSDVEMNMEKEYLRLFFANLFYIHPFLSQTIFASKCETLIWSQWPLSEISRGDQHFVALYNIVLAVGSLTGSSDTFAIYKEQLDNDPDAGHSDISSAASSIQLSKMFFDRAKRLLGDCFEVCSLESAQTLILMVNVFHMFQSESLLILAPTCKSLY